LLALADYERLSDTVTGSAEDLARDLESDVATVECLVAEHQGELVGYALFFPTYGSFRARSKMWLEDLFVEPRARKLGVGNALLAGVAKRALARGCVQLDWYVLDWNQLAIDFYERIGATRPQVDWVQYGVGEEQLKALAAAAT